MSVLFSKIMQTASRYSPHKVISFIFHLPSMVRLCFRLLNDNRVPFHLKAFCYGAILYLILPFDLLPDFPSVYLGRADDIMLLYFAFNKLMKDSPPEVIEEHIADLRGKKRES